MKDVSIFKQLYENEIFTDRFLNNSTNAVDIVIPCIHTNELWEKNLISIYREIPVNRLLIGDGGCIDDTIETVKKFPRVEIFDHTEYKTLGYSVLKLIDEVQTEFFLYLHSDVYIPQGWFDKMYKNTEKYDWCECEQKIVSLIEFNNRFADVPQGFGFGGTQLGRKKAFDDIQGEMDDDYVYRNEDIIIRTMLQKKGHKWGFDDTLFHYHQVMQKEGFTKRKFKNINIEVEMPKEEEIRTHEMQVKGFVKYLEPSPILISLARRHLRLLLKISGGKYSDFRKWVKKTNPKWLKYFSIGSMFHYELNKIYREMKVRIKNEFRRRML